VLRISYGLLADAQLEEALARLVGGIEAILAAPSPAGP